MRLHRFATPQALARALARRFVATAREAIAARGVFRVALAGGSTPQALYEALAGAAIDWSSVEFFWSDERFVPASDPHSNEGMARRALLGRVGATARTLSVGLMPIGSLVAGIALDAVGGQATLAAMGGLILVVVVVFALMPDVRRARLTRHSIPA